MSILSNIGKRLFRRESKASTVGASNSKLTSYNSLFSRKDNLDIIPYKTGVSILRDSQVATGFEILKYLLSSKKWVLTNTDDESTEIYDFTNDMLHNMEIEIQTLVKQMVSAMMWGFNVHELLFDVNNDGRLVITNAVPLHIKTLQEKPFNYDKDTGELISIHQELSTGGSADIPADKCLVYSYNSQYDELEGHGLLHDFLPIVEDKENLMDWLMTFAERNGNPTMYGKTNDPLSRNDMLDAFDDIANGTMGLTIGLEEDVGVLESSHNGEIFFNALAYKDNQILRRMFIGDLMLGGTNTQTGSYAQSQTQMEFGNMVFDGILEDIANIIQSKLDMVNEFNFGSDRKFPIFSFDKFTTGDMKKLFEIIKPLMDSGVLDSENSAVHEALSLLFKTEAGVEYVNEEPEMPEEDFGYQEETYDNEFLTDEILDDLDAITG